MAELNITINSESAETQLDALVTYAKKRASEIQEAFSDLKLEMFGKGAGIDKLINDLTKNMQSNAKVLGSTEVVYNNFKKTLVGTQAVIKENASSFKASETAIKQHASEFKKLLSDYHGGRTHIHDFEEQMGRLWQKGAIPEKQFTQWKRYTDHVRMAQEYMDKYGLSAEKMGAAARKAWGLSREESILLNKALVAHRKDIDAAGSAYGRLHTEVKRVHERGQLMNKMWAKFSIYMSGIAATIFVFQNIVRVLSQIITQIMGFEKSLDTLGQDFNLNIATINLLEKAAREFGTTSNKSAKDAIIYFRSMMAHGLSAGEAIEAFQKKLAKESSRDSIDSLDDAFQRFKNILAEVNYKWFDLFGPAMKQSLDDLAAWVSKNSDEIIASINTVLKTAGSFVEIGKDLLTVASVPGQMLRSILDGWNALPKVIQEIGIIGAIFGGAKARLVIIGAVAAVGGLVDAIKELREGPSDQTKFLGMIKNLEHEASVLTNIVIPSIPKDDLKTLTKMNDRLSVLNQQIADYKSKILFTKPEEHWTDATEVAGNALAKTIEAANKLDEIRRKLVHEKYGDDPFVKNWLRIEQYMKQWRKENEDLKDSNKDLYTELEKNAEQAFKQVLSYDNEKMAELYAKSLRKTHETTLADIDNEISAIQKAALEQIRIELAKHNDIEKIRDNAIDETNKLHEEAGLLFEKMERAEINAISEKYKKWLSLTGLSEKEISRLHEAAALDKTKIEAEYNKKYEALNKKRATFVAAIDSEILKQKETDLKKAERLYQSFAEKVAKYDMESLSGKEAIEIILSNLEAEIAFVEKHIGRLSEEFKAALRLAATDTLNKKFRNDMLQAMKSLYEDLENISGSYYDAQSQILDIELEKYKESLGLKRKTLETAVGKDKELFEALYKWRRLKQAELDKQLLIYSGGYFGGIKAYLIQAQIDWDNFYKNVGELGYETFEELGKTIDQTLVAVWKDDFDTIGDMWEELMDKLIDDFLAMLAELVRNWAMAGIGDMINNSFSGSMGGLSGGGAGGLMGDLLGLLGEDIFGTEAVDYATGEMFRVGGLFGSGGALGMGGAGSIAAMLGELAADLSAVTAVVAGLVIFGSIMHNQMEPDARALTTTTTGLSENRNKLFGPLNMQFSAEGFSDEDAQNQMARIATELAETFGMYEDIWSYLSDESQAALKESLGDINWDDLKIRIINIAKDGSPLYSVIDKYYEMVEILSAENIKALETGISSEINSNELMRRLGMGAIGGYYGDAAEYLGELIESVAIPDELKDIILSSGMLSGVNVQAYNELFNAFQQAATDMQINPEQLPSDVVSKILTDWLIEQIQAMGDAVGDGLRLPGTDEAGMGAIHDLLRDYFADYIQESLTNIGDLDIVQYMSDDVRNKFAQLTADLFAENTEEFFRLWEESADKIIKASNIFEKLENLSKGIDFTKMDQLGAMAAAWAEAYKKIMEASGQEISEEDLVALQTDYLDALIASTEDIERAVMGITDLDLAVGALNGTFDAYIKQLEDLGVEIEKITDLEAMRMAAMNRVLEDYKHAIGIIDDEEFYTAQKDKIWEMYKDYFPSMEDFLDWFKGAGIEDIQELADMLGIDWTDIANDVGWLMEAIKALGETAEDVADDMLEKIRDFQDSLKDSSWGATYADLAGKYGDPVNKWTQDYAQNIIDQFKSMTPEEVAAWAESLGISVDDFLDDMQRMIDAFDEAAQAFEAWADVPKSIQELKGYSTDLENTIDNINEAFKEFIKTGEEVGATTDEFADLLADWVETLLKAANVVDWDMFADFGLADTNEIRSVINALEEAFDKMREFADDFGLTTEEIDRMLADAIDAVMEAASQNIQDAITELAGAIGDAFSEVDQKIRDLVNTFAELNAAFDDLVETERKLQEERGANYGRLADMEIDRIEGLLRAAGVEQWNVTDEYGSKWVSDLNRLVEELTKGFKNLLDISSEALGFTNLRGQVEDLAAIVGSYDPSYLNMSLEGFLEWYVAAFEAAANDPNITFEGLDQPVQDFFTHLAEQMGMGLDQVLDLLYQMGKTDFADISAMLDNAIHKLLTSLFDEIETTIYDLETGPLTKQLDEAVKWMEDYAKALDSVSEFLEDSDPNAIAEYYQQMLYAFDLMTAEIANTIISNFKPAQESIAQISWARGQGNINPMDMELEWLGKTKDEFRTILSGMILELNQGLVPDDANLDDLAEWATTLNDWYMASLQQLFDDANEALQKAIDDERKAMERGTASGAFGEGYYSLQERQLATMAGVAGYEYDPLSMLVGSEGLQEWADTQRELAQAAYDAAVAWLDVSNTVKDLISDIENLIRDITYSKYNIGLPRVRAESAQLDYETLKAAAMTGGEEEIRAFMDFTRTYLDEMQNTYKSSAEYQSRYAQVQEDLLGFKSALEAGSYDQRFLEEMQRSNEISEEQQAIIDAAQAELNARLYEIQDVLDEQLADLNDKFDLAVEALESQDYFNYDAWEAIVGEFIGVTEEMSRIFDDVLIPGFRDTYDSFAAFLEGEFGTPPPPGTQPPIPPPGEPGTPGGALNLTQTLMEFWETFMQHPTPGIYDKTLEQLSNLGLLSGIFVNTFHLQEGGRGVADLTSEMIGVQVDAFATIIGLLVGIFQNTYETARTLGAQALDWAGMLGYWNFPAEALLAYHSTPEGEEKNLSDFLSGGKNLAGSAFGSENLLGLRGLFGEDLFGIGDEALDDLGNLGLLAGILHNTFHLQEGGRGLADLFDEFKTNVESFLNDVYGVGAFLVTGSISIDNWDDMPEIDDFPLGNYTGNTMLEINALMGNLALAGSKTVEDLGNLGLLAGILNNTFHLQEGGRGIADLFSSVTRNSTYVAVTGTFYPPVQPVSGTFYLATQPISNSYLAYLPTMSGYLSSIVANTAGGSSFPLGNYTGYTMTSINALMGNLPLINSKTVADLGNLGLLAGILNNTFHLQHSGSGIANLFYSTMRNGNALAVVGTFYLPTQPVSGTFFLATQPISNSYLSYLPTMSSDLNSIKINTAGGSAFPSGNYTNYTMTSINALMSNLPLINSKTVADLGNLGLLAGILNNTFHLQEGGHGVAELVTSVIDYLAEIAANTGMMATIQLATAGTGGINFDYSMVKLPWSNEYVPKFVLDMLNAQSTYENFLKGIYVPNPNSPNTYAFGKDWWRKLFDPLAEFQSGGVASGPESGYPVMLHGVERITPIDEWLNGGSDPPINLELTINLDGQIMDKRIIQISRREADHVRVSANVRPGNETRRLYQ